jgi:hypothetical protein
MDVVARTLLFGVFVFSLAGKVRGRAAYADFADSVAALWPGPRRWIRVVSVATVAAEAAVVVLLVAPATAVAGLLAAAGILAVFTAAILSAVHRRERAPCRCFGRSDTALGTPHVVRNAVLLLVSLLGLVGAAADTPARHPGGMALALALAAVALLLVLRFDDVVAVVAPRSRSTVHHRQLSE